MSGRSVPLGWSALPAKSTLSTVHKGWLKNDDRHVLSIARRDCLRRRCFLRDAIDFAHACIYSTIKGMKFSNFFQVCGGPIELAVISTDRKFRWVRHKAWDAAIDEE